MAWGAEVSTCLLDLPQLYCHLSSTAEQDSISM